MAKADKTRKKSTTSYVVYADTHQKVKYVALMEGRNLTDLLDEALNSIVDRYEKKNGPIPIK